jgi:hypothetical protein
VPQTAEFDIEYRVDSDPSFNTNYAYQANGRIHTWNDSNSTVNPKMPFSWDIDPGSGNDVVLAYEVYPVHG